jgi:hypothetical protein
MSNPNANNEENFVDESSNLDSPDNLRKFHFLREEERRHTKEEKKPPIKKKKTKESIHSPETPDSEIDTKREKTISFNTVEINKNRLEGLAKKASIISEKGSAVHFLPESHGEMDINASAADNTDNMGDTLDHPLKAESGKYIDLSKIQITKLQSRNKDFGSIRSEKEGSEDEDKAEDAEATLEYTKNTHRYMDYTDDNLLDNHSEHSLFYKNAYFRDVNMYEDDDHEAEHRLKINIKDDLLYKSRLVHTYLNPKTVVMPKFTKVSEKERKCKEILGFQEADTDHKARLFHDPYPFLECRRMYYRYASKFNKLCLSIVRNKYFDNISLAVILVNTVLILISDPNADDSPADLSDSYFLYFYTVEMFLKIFAYGFVLIEGSYLRDLWNILDFCVIVFGWLSYMLTYLVNGSAIKGLSGLRAFRILRPLKTVKSIKGLRDLIVILLESLMGLGDITIVLFFFFLIFAIAGVQMWQGLFKRRCMNTNLGYIDKFTDFTTMCTLTEDCALFNKPGSQYACIKTNLNPNNDVTHFDNTMNALITVFVIATMEGWTDIWSYVNATFKDSFGINKVIIFFYFHILLFVGGYYLINLFLAVVMDTFDKIKASKKVERVRKNHKSLFSELLIKDHKKKEKKNKKEEKMLMDIAIENIQKEFDFIEKNHDHIPISYKTLEDIYVLNTMTPAEIYGLKHRIIIEAKKVVQECETKIEVYIQSLKPTQPLDRMEKESKEDYAKKETLDPGRKISHMNTVTTRGGRFSKKLVQISVNETLQKLKNESKKQINEKDAGKKDKAHGGAAFISQKKRTTGRILTDLSLEESVEEKNRTKLDEDKDEVDNLSFLSSPSEIEKKVVKRVFEEPKRSYSVCAIRKQPIDASKSIFNKITFNKPSNRISEFSLIKKEIIRNRKREDKRKRFDVDQYVRQLYPNYAGRKNSYLGMMRHLDIEASSKDETPDLTYKTHSRKNKTTSFDVSLYHDDHIIMDSKSELDIDKHAQIELSKNVVNEIDNDDRQFENNRNKKNSYAAESKSGKRNTVALSRGDMILDNIERPIVKKNIGSLLNNLTKNPSQRLTRLQKVRTKIIQEDVGVVSSEKTVRTTFKSASVEKNINKFPNLDEFEKIKAMDNFTGQTEDEKLLRSKKSEVNDFLQNYRKYLNYVNNILDKDFAIKDGFSVDDSKEDVLGEEPDRPKSVMRYNDRDPVKFFNDSKINLKSYQYVSFLHFELLEEEMLNINHNLAFLTSKIIQSMPAKKKDFGLVKSRKKTTINSSTRLIVGSGSTGRSSITYGTQRGSTFMDDSTKRKASRSSIGIHHLQLEDKFAARKANLEDLFKSGDSITFKRFNYIFENDDQVLNKRTKAKKRWKKFEKTDADKGYEVRDQIEKIKIFDTETNMNKYKEWSAREILALDDDDEMYPQWNEEMKRLEEFNIILWKENFIIRFFQKFRYILYSLSISAQFDFFIIFIVIVNAIFMSLDGDLLDPVVYQQIQISNYIFNGIFIFEFVVKLFGLGPLIYFADPFTYLDMMIIGFAILDMATSSDSASTSGSGKNSIASQLSFLRVLRVFRIFRVIRLAKVLRKIKAMGDIIRGISRSLNDLKYNMLILFIFILIFQLLGMSLLNDSPLFQSFMSSFYITFQTLTTENWNQTLYTLSLMSKLTVLYLVVWIFIGNYILYNLFVSILLNSFDNFGDKSEDDIDFPENFPEVFKVYELAEKEYKDRLKQRKKASGEKVQDEDEYSEDEEEALGKTKFMDTTSIDSQEVGSTIVMSQREKINTLFKDNDCENSLFIFSQTNGFRIWCMHLICWKRFDQFIMMLILVSTLRLILDTFLDGSLIDMSFNIADIIFTMIFLAEMIFKIIALGFVMDKGSYLQDNWNKIDFVIVVVSLIDLQGLLSKMTGNQNSSSLSFLKVLRLLRTLRPLRFISHNVQLKLIITSLFDSIEPILSVLAVVFVVYFIFSIIGMNLFYDLYQLCYLKNSNNINPFFNPVVGWADLLAQNGIDDGDAIAVNAFVRRF